MPDDRYVIFCVCPPPSSFFFSSSNHFSNSTAHSVCQRLAILFSHFLSSVVCFADQFEARSSENFFALLCSWEQTKTTKTPSVCVWAFSINCVCVLLRVSEREPISIIAMITRSKTKALNERKNGPVQEESGSAVSGGSKRRSGSTSTPQRASGKRTTQKKSNSTNGHKTVASTTRKRRASWREHYAYDEEIEELEEEEEQKEQEQIPQRGAKVPCPSAFSFIILN